MGMRQVGIGKILMKRIGTLTLDSPPIYSFKCAGVLRGRPKLEIGWERAVEDG